MSAESDQRPALKLRSAEIGVALVLFTLGAIVIFDSLRLGMRWGDEGPQPGYFPFYLGVFICSACAVTIALAALMPIVAGIGGNSGNQTVTMIVRALALGQIQRDTWASLIAKEIGVALLNGVVWGTLLGAVAYALYGSIALGGVMALAMLLNLVLAATMGVAIPWLRSRLGRDPALGSSVLITACTDSGGFFIFLGLATLLLV